MAVLEGENCDEAVLFYLAMFEKCTVVVVVFEVMKNYFHLD